MPGGRLWLWGNAGWQSDTTAVATNTLHPSGNNQRRCLSSVDRSVRPACGAMLRGRVSNPVYFFLIVLNSLLQPSIIALPSSRTRDKRPKDRGFRWSRTLAALHHGDTVDAPRLST